MSPELAAFVDREAIRDCVARLARGEDRRSAELIRGCWWPEARFDYGVHSGDFETYLAWVVPGADAIKDTQHLIGQSFIELDGDRAKAETHVFSYHRVDMGNGDRDTCIGGRYLDSFEKRGGVWRIAGRVMLYDWEQDWGAAADWSRGVMGYPFTAEHFPGRAKGDYSEAWFAGDRG
ncbi:MAG: nuclear transport factor 2 family protein [Novosphingobium sp.]|uniref:nuclear transport factor 2 family protein n=1 Tax=Novosphingobium sp. TaxID=1874826 RepID=UPI0012BFB4ED|nr:nuclear transport factor 2 family protein [Novosphingobium sp.]MPS68334.1 nuclear transport factor 2 family protein [Novosphingobium sp.]